MRATLASGKWPALFAALAGAAGTAVVAFVLAAGSQWQATAQAATKRAKVVRAGEFILQDAGGAKRADLHLVRGEPSLDMYGRKGERRVAVGINGQEIARVRFFDSQGIPRGALGVTQDGRVALVFIDGARRVRATFELSQDGRPTLSLDGTKGPRIGLHVTGANTAGVALLDGAHKTRAALDVDGNGNPTLTLYGPSGKPVASLP